MAGCLARDVKAGRFGVRTYPRGFWRVIESVMLIVPVRLLLTKIPALPPSLAWLISEQVARDVEDDPFAAVVDRAAVPALPLLALPHRAVVRKQAV